MVPFQRPGTDIRVRPTTFDEIVEWLERWSNGLVLLEEYPLSDVREAVAAVESAVSDHRASADRWVGLLKEKDDATARRAQLVLDDHAWFVTSLEQFWWFFRVVEKEDHGGHRQALGQYGRVLAEALRRHLGDERQLALRSSAVPGGPVP